MALLISTRVSASIAALAKVASEYIEGIEESNGHSMHDGVVAARFDVRHCRVPIAAFEHIREAVALLDGFSHRLGAMRWVCTALGTAALEVDLHMNRDELAFETAATRALGKRQRDSEDSGKQLELAAPASKYTAGALVTAGMQARELFARSLAALDRDLGGVDGKFLKSLDVCRVPRVRAPAAFAAVTAFENALYAARHGYQSVQLVMQPVCTDKHSACTCIEVTTVGPIALRIGDVARSVETIEAAAAEFFLPRISMRHNEVCMTLDATTPACPLHMARASGLL
jgi:hypothetical protein